MGKFSGTRTYGGSGSAKAKWEAIREARAEGGHAKTVSSGEQAGTVIITGKEGEVKQVISRTGQDITGQAQVQDVRKGVVTLQPQMQEQTRTQNIPMGTPTQTVKTLAPAKPDLLTSTFSKAPEGTSFGFWERIKNIPTTFLIATRGRGLGQEKLTSEGFKISMVMNPSSLGLTLASYGATKLIGSFTSKYRYDVSRAEGTTASQYAIQKETLKGLTSENILAQQPSLEAKGYKFTSISTQEGVNINVEAPSISNAPKAFEFKTPSILGTLINPYNPFNYIKTNTKVLAGTSEENIAMGVGLGMAGLRWGISKGLEKLPFKQDIVITNPISREVGRFSVPEQQVLTSPTGKPITISTGKNIKYRQFETTAKADVTTYKDVFGFKTNKQISEVDIKSMSLVENLKPKITRSVSTFQASSEGISGYGKSLGITEYRGRLSYTKETTGMVYGTKPNLQNIKIIEGNIPSNLPKGVKAVSFDTLSNAFRLKGTAEPAKVLGEKGTLLFSGKQYTVLKSDTPLTRFLSKGEGIVYNPKGKSLGIAKSAEEVHYVSYLKSEPTSFDTGNIGTGRTITKTTGISKPVVMPNKLITSIAENVATKSAPMKLETQPKAFGISIGKTKQQTKQIQMQFEKTKPYVKEIGISRPATGIRSITPTVTRTSSITGMEIKPIEIQVPIEIPQQQQQQRQQQIYETPITTIFNKQFGLGIPFIPIPFLPRLSLGLEESSSLRKFKGKPKYRYTPSYTAMVFNIFGKQPKGKETGFRIRPITKGFRWW